jgi:hypothetical protein
VDADGDGQRDDRHEVPMAFIRQVARKASNGPLGIAHRG